jgi:hypothetical protein
MKIYQKEYITLVILNTDLGKFRVSSEKMSQLEYWSEENNRWILFQDFDQNNENHVRILQEAQEELKHKILQLPRLHLPE